MIHLTKENGFNEYNLFTKSLDELPQKSHTLVNTINQYSYCIAQNDKDFKQSLKMSDVLLPDGVGVVAAARILTGRAVKKIAGYDLHNYLLKKLNKKGGSVFYMGSTEQTLKKIRERIALEYPNIRIKTYSPPFKPELTDEDNRQIIREVNTFNPDVLFVGMTAPKQEVWAYKHKNMLNAKLICTIGAVFDFYAGTIERPGKVWINLGLEWLGRLVHEPKRLWRRYLYFGPVFVGMIFKEKVEELSKAA
jgi:N-acetylglucosaminyldiphosphoundecaprenol N-acetyl-beta-D-mannosaminyltransferase